MVSDLKLSTVAANVITNFLRPWYRPNIGRHRSGKTGGEKGQGRGEFSRERGEGGGNRRLHLTSPWIKPETMVKNMSSLVERLRARSDRRPIYSLDLSDDEADLMHGKYGPEKFERIVREDAIVLHLSLMNASLLLTLSAKDDSCQSCGESGNMLECETCTYAYHPKCLLPPLKAPFPGGWKCPECVSPLTEIDKILDCEKRPAVADDADVSELESKQNFVKHYLVKWKGLSYLHCTWVPENEFLDAYKTLPRLKTKVNNFQRLMASLNNSEDDYVAIRPEWTTVERILACRGDDGEKEYLVKFKELSYDECYWEFESDICAFQPEIERFYSLQSKRRKHSSINFQDIPHDAKESQRKNKEFQQYEKSPEFLSGGSLHPYQLEGLNFLRFSWSKQTHVILADEMGLGKTIQSIAFLASLFEEGINPHLVVAPLSTLRNWEREFATWAPQMNVVMYVGSAQARAFIREYEFYYPKKSGSKKLKKKKSGQSKSKQDRIKFDVLLTSYEMINLDCVSLKPIKWESMVVDEGHRLKNKDSKLFLQLKQFSSKHRVLLTGTPLQLPVFVHCVGYLHRTTPAPEILYSPTVERISELILFLSPGNLAAGANIWGCQNNLDELFMLMHFLDAGKFGSLEEFQEEFRDINQEEQISRLHKMLAPHLLRRVKKDVMTELPPKKELILRVELSSKQKEYYKAILTRNYELLTRKGGGQRWQYERIDGKVSGAERQIRIDRFNAKNSSKFCFLLSTRAGGLGINLATADTVIIYDSDWNPHADLQAMARAHRLGQTNKVMIYRLITRGSIEERMMQMTKKKMVLEHLVVGKLKTQNINQEELDDIIRYGSKELFADETEEAKARQIHYDDAAIDRLLDRERVGDEETTLDEEDDNEFLKAFKVANFEYVDEAEAAAEEEALKAAVEPKIALNSSERTTYWEDLLRDRYEVHKVEEFNSLGKGKRSRRQMVSVEDDDLAGLENVSSDGQDDNYEAELTDGETPSTVAVAPSSRRPYRKRARVDGVESLPLMEGEGKSFRVLGFNQSHRAQFVQVLMRFGVGEYDWAEFVPRLKHKSYEEIKKYVILAACIFYGILFLSHLAEEFTDSPTFSDGVPKEGLRVQDVLLRIAVLLLIKDKVKSASEICGDSLFSAEIQLYYPALKGGRVWKREHDLMLLRAVLKHGYGRWQAILDDKDLRIQDIVCQELNLPVINLAELGGGQSQSESHPTRSEPPGDPLKGIGSENGPGAVPAGGVTDANNLLYQFREIQRRQVEFVKKRVLLLEKGLNAEYQKECFVSSSVYLTISLVFGADGKSNGICGGEPENANKIADVTNAVTGLMGKLPHIEALAAEEVSSVSYNANPRRQQLVQHYDEICKVLAESETEAVQACLANEADATLANKLCRLRDISEKVYQILSASKNHPNLNEPAPLKDEKEWDEAQSCVQRSGLPPNSNPASNNNGG
ncbi:hypothetical protein Cgig2_002109 [Carnegiea gigantea]|uniref:CHD3-type chromatin-remodeling factor PICKLE n=1 Tax=Carnegiea gigantea TaxID=171969 RepID=A0A9Q1KVE7_9CARY|nr:hypothetical protein Cgig2_002109 [Carnegiea gigantea]